MPTEQTGNAGDNPAATLSPYHSWRPPALYNERLNPAAQLDAEETIAFMLFSARDAEEGEGAGLDEETCAELGRRVLLTVLAQFRPDLMREPINRDAVAAASLDPTLFLLTRAMLGDFLRKNLDIFFETQLDGIGVAEREPVMLMARAIANLLDPDGDSPAS